MKTKNKCYTLRLGSDLQERLSRFTAQLKGNERIVAQSIDNTNNVLIISTVEEVDDKTNKRRPKNLLLEEIQRGDFPDVFGGAIADDSEEG